MAVFAGALGSSAPKSLHRVVDVLRTWRFTPSGSLDSKRDSRRNPGFLLFENFVVIAGFTGFQVTQAESDSDVYLCRVCIYHQLFVMVFYDL